MVTSMTGFAKAENEKNDIHCSVEIKSVNSKYLKIDANVSGGFSEIEVRTSRFLRERLKRGSIKVFIDIVFLKKTDVIQVDLGIAGAYYKALKTIADEFKIPDRVTLGVMSGMKDIMKYQVSRELNEKIWDCLEDALEEAIENLNKDRENEGKNLHRVLKDYLKKLDGVTDELEKTSSNFTDYYRDLISQRISELVDHELDSERLEQEVAILAEKADISEEIVRLKSHIESFSEILDDGNEVGLRLDFLCQEMHRELSTIAAKSKKTEISSLSVEGRTLVNKLREQVQNVE
ncbi:MAG: YicC family protein [Kosmotoga sp.]|nr:MAG: YicC family protein [Kosmotoga sp.]